MWVFRLCFRVFRSCIIWEKVVRGGEWSGSSFLKQFTLCVRNDECEDLEKRKVYESIPDEEAAQDGYIRALDESGEDYLYPESYFVRIELPQEAEKALRAAGSQEAGRGSG